MDLLDDLTLGDIEEQYRELAEMIGLETFKRLVKYAGGAQLTIPTRKTVQKILRNKRILKEYTGYNVRELATKYQLSDSAVYYIVRRSSKTGETK